MMNIRPSRSEEIPQQKALWKKCFGDPDAYIDNFYENFCTADQVLVVETDGAIDSMTAVLPFTVRLPDGGEVPVGYVYALATDPRVQGRGRARQLLAWADGYLAEKGIKAMVLVPATPSLHRFFDGAGLSECFGTRTAELPASGLTGNTGGTVMTAISPGEYNQVREDKLAKTFHVSYSDHLIGMQQFASRMSGCDLYKIQVDSEVGCAAMEYVQKDRLLVKELVISPDKLSRAVEAIAARHPASNFHIRTPAFWEGLSGSDVQPFGMIKWYDQELKSKWSSRLDAYMGLGFD